MIGSASASCGEISPEDIGKLGGNFGIPNIKMGPVVEEKEN